MTIRLALVAGARPNFMKVAPLIRALRRTSGFRWRLIHTGQHYDREMSGVFFDELGIPQPNVSLECGGGTQAEQTAKTMVALERDLTAHPVDCVVVVGDVNSTVAAALAAKKLQLRLAHVEAGLRSGDRTMPEEINRLVTDSISDLFLVTEPSGIQALLREGHDPTSIRHVGNLMIDNLFHQLERLQAADPAQYQTTALKAGLERTGYGVVTLHRASNVDDRATLAGLIGALNEISRQLPLVFPVHPRTHARMQSFGLAAADAVRLTSPLSYMEFLNLWKDARVVLTDSGGLQEETTALGVKCVTCLLYTSPSPRDRG